MHDVVEDLSGEPLNETLGWAISLGLAVMESQEAKKPGIDLNLPVPYSLASVRVCVRDFHVRWHAPWHVLVK